MAILRYGGCTLTAAVCSVDGDRKIQNLEAQLQCQFDNLTLFFVLDRKGGG